MTPLCWFACGLLLGAEPEAKPAEAWHTVVLFAEKDLSVRLRVRKQTSLAGVEWLALEFDNCGKKPLTVRDAHYWLASERDSLRTPGQLLLSGGLASGNTFDLFPHAWKTTPVSPIVLAVGQNYRVVTHPSDYSAALLAQAPADGLRVRARVSLTLNFADGRSLRTPDEGVAFTFDWLPLDEAGRRAVLDRLKGLLEKPEDRVPHCYILDTLLRVAGKQVSCQELLAGLERRDGAFSGRNELARFLAEHFGQDPAVKAWYAERLGKGDRRAAADLAHGRLWDPAFAEPLIRLFEASPSRAQEALYVLHTHRTDWLDKPGAPGRLSAAVLQGYLLAGKKPADLNGDQLSSWSWNVHLLALTGDRRLVEQLRPALEDRRVHLDARHVSLIPGMRLPPTRVCDSALEAILTLLDGSPDAAYARAGWDKRGPDPAYLKVRDQMIGELKKRLDR